ncbi:hypothetical protein PM082_008921 [Marasmius tenuissimus]|nr:hypothetical protein PM082_008921 [Marasmius tenuissimus]
MPVYVIPVLVTRAFPAVKATTVDLFTIQSTISSLGWNLCSRLPDSPQTKATFASYPQRHHSQILTCTLHLFATNQLSSARKVQR